MTYPVKPADHYDYVAYQEDSPTLPLPAPFVAADFDHLKGSTDEIIDFLKGSFTSEGVLRAEKLPGSASATSGAGTAPPGRVVAVRADGSRLTSDYVADPSMRRIKRIYAVDNVIYVEFEDDHTFAAGGLVFCRVYGRDGLSDRAHPANNWSGGVLRNPTTGVQSSAAGSYAWGGDPWAIEVVDTTTIRFPGSALKASPSDPDPVFEAGYCYEVGWSGISNALYAAADWLGSNGGTILVGGGGYFFNEGDAGFILPSNVKLQMAGETQTHLIAGDFFNRQILACFGENWEVCDGALWGNRMFMGQGRHAMRVGDETAGQKIRNAAIRRLTDIGSSGYGINWGKKADKIGVIVEDVTIIEPNNDGADIKNKSNGNRRNRVVNLHVRSHGMGTVGTNRGMVRQTLQSNPIATVNDGRTTVAVTLKFKAQVNQTVWLSETTANGVAIGGWYRVISKSNYVATIQTGQTANATGSAGGSSVQSQQFRREPGSAALDIRGPGWIVVAPRVSGLLDQVVGIRTRGGSGSNGNGEGGHRSMIVGMVAEDETPYTTSNFVAMVCQADACSIVGGTLNGIGGNSKGASVGVQIGGSSTGAVVKGMTITGFGTGVKDGGDKSDVDVTVINCGTSVYVDGDPIATEGPLDPDTPFEITTAGSNPTVIVKHEAAHGYSVGGASVTYSDAAVDLAVGVDMNDTFTVGTILDSLRYTVTATGQVAAATGTFGGSQAEFSAAPQAHVATSNQIVVRSFGAYGRPVDITLGATNTKIVKSHAESSGLTSRDLSSSTIWGPGNTGEIPNLQRVVTLSAAENTRNLTMADSEMIFVRPASATGKTTLNLPDPGVNPVIGFTAKFIDRTGSNGGMRVKTPAGFIIVGTNASTGMGYVESSTAGATGVITCMAENRYNFEPTTGPWTLT